jgi:hypothetical protein
VPPTPDRRPGALIEDEEIIFDTDTGASPSVDGAFTYDPDSGRFRFRDAIGTYDPRSVAPAPVGATGDVQLNGTDSTFDAETDTGYSLNYSKTNRRLTIGPSGTSLSNNPLLTTGNVNSFVQSNVQNINSGTTASSDVVATSNTGTDTSNFVNLGINSSGNTDSGFTIAGANDSYLYSNGGHLVIGTESASRDVRFFTAGTLSANERGRFTAAGSFVLGTGALATSATDGFIYIPASAGAPTGTPNTFAGRVPLSFDTNANALKFYSTGAWRSVDPSLIQRDWKDSVRVCTPAALPANTRSGNTLTANVNGTIPTQDDVTLSVGDRILVRHEATGANNGIYRVVSVGSGSTPWVLTRTDDADTSAKVTSGVAVYVSEGTVSAGDVFILSTPDTITLNTTSLTFTRLRTKTRHLETNAAGTITTTSTTDTLVTGMTLTPGAGTYLVFFSSDWQNGTNNASNFATIYAGGTAVANSARQYTRPNALIRVGVMVSGVATVTDGQSIEIRWRVSAGTGTMGNRSLMLIQVS